MCGGRGRKKKNVNIVAVLVYSYSNTHTNIVELKLDDSVASSGLPFGLTELQHIRFPTSNHVDL